MGRRREAVLLVALWLAAAAPVFAIESAPATLGIGLPEEPAELSLRGQRGTMRRRA
jgi:hypothetical protein